VEWGKGWAEGFGIPEDWEARTWLLVDRLTATQDMLATVAAMGGPEIKAAVDAFQAECNRPCGNLVPLRVTV
jgi:hypothetical protein